MDEVAGPVTAVEVKSAVVPEGKGKFSAVPAVKVTGFATVFNELPIMRFVDAPSKVITPEPLLRAPVTEAVSVAPFLTVTVPSTEFTTLAVSVPPLTVTVPAGTEPA